VDLPRAIHYFTFDAGGVFSFSKPFGFLQKRGDIDGILKTMRNGAKILHMVSRQSHCVEYATDFMEAGIRAIGANVDRQESYGGILWLHRAAYAFRKEIHTLPAN
jgi:hypothetical protein